jgi:hypothetical protein
LAPGGGGGTGGGGGANVRLHFEVSRATGAFFVYRHLDRHLDSATCPEAADAACGSEEEGGGVEGIHREGELALVYLCQVAKGDVRSLEEGERPEAVRHHDTWRQVSGCI